MHAKDGLDCLALIFANLPRIRVIETCMHR